MRIKKGSLRQSDRAFDAQDGLGAITSPEGRVSTFGTWYGGNGDLGVKVGGSTGDCDIEQVKITRGIADVGWQIGRRGSRQRAKVNAAGRVKVSLIAP